MTKKLPNSSKILFISILLLLIACTGGKVISTLLGFFNTQSPKTVAIGQPIVSKVTLSYSTISNEVHFKGFVTKEIAPNHFVINAPARVIVSKDLTALATVWLLDTTYVLPTKGPGQYVLDFEDSNGDVKTDTVLVQ